MWWLDPGKELLNIVFNRILAPYVENMDMSQVSYGIAQGELTLHNLKLKKGILDKFDLPVDVVRGHLGTFSMTFHWRDLGNKPVEVKIEDIYILTSSTSGKTSTTAEDEEKAYALKMERLKNTEMLKVRTAADDSKGEQSRQNQSLITSLTAKIINNLQITVKNIHVRYEDSQTDPDHPFAIGFTLAGFTAVSTDENWVPAFIESTAGSIRKLARLESMAVYFDKDIQILTELPDNEYLDVFYKMISKIDEVPDHQFILKPVTGEGRITMHHEPSNEVPGIDVQLSFEEIAFVLDRQQYQDVLSSFDFYHYHARRNKYRTFRPTEEELYRNRPRALLLYAGKTVLDQVHQKNRQWSWAYFRQRREDRKQYIDLYKRKLLGSIAVQDLPLIQNLERKLSYQDLRLYRQISRSQLRKDEALRKKLQAEQQPKDQSYFKSWSNWVWGSTESNETQSQSSFDGTMTDEQRKELYQALDYDEKAALTESLLVTRDSLKFKVETHLRKGSLSLSDAYIGHRELLSFIFDDLRALYIQRTDNFETELSLGDIQVYDGTTQGTLYKQIVRVKDSRKTFTNHTGIENELPLMTGNTRPFFSLRFAKNPSDEQSDASVSIFMQSTEIVYHKGYLEAVYKFFMPEPSQWQSVEIILDAANETFEGIRNETKANLEKALENHTTIDLHLEMQAPIIIIPESVVSNKCNVLLLDAGQISIRSSLVDKKSKRLGDLKRQQEISDEDLTSLAPFIYDKYTVRLEAAQLVCGNDLYRCFKALEVDTPEHGFHLLERVNMELAFSISIVPSLRSFSRFKILGKLPMLQINFSDVKYRAILRLFDVIVPHFESNDDTARDSLNLYSQPNAHSDIVPFSHDKSFSEGSEYNLDEREDDMISAHTENGRDLMLKESSGRESHQNIICFTFQVDMLQARILRSSESSEESLVGAVVLSDYSMIYETSEDNMKVDIRLKSLTMNVLREGREISPFITCPEVDALENKHLMTISYIRTNKIRDESDQDHPEQELDVRLSLISFQLAPTSILTIYDFVTTTFKSEEDARIGTIDEEQHSGDPNHVTEPTTSDISTRLMFTLAGIQVTLKDGDADLVTVSLLTADVQALLYSESIKMTARVGNIAITDNSTVQIFNPAFKQILSVEGEEFAEIQYRTYDSAEKEEKEASSHFSIVAGSIMLHFSERPIRNMYLFSLKLARLKTVYDAAAQAAVQRASNLARTNFEVKIQSPMLIFPYDISGSDGRFTMKLGEFMSNNSYQRQSHSIKFSLRGIELTSTSFENSDPINHNLLDKFDIVANAMQSYKRLDPQYEVAVTVNDLCLFLSQAQYRQILHLGESLTHTFENPQDEKSMVTVMTPRNMERNDSRNAITSGSLERSSTGLSDLTGQLLLNLTVSVSTIKICLYEKLSRQVSDVELYGIAQLVVLNSSFNLALASNGAVEIVLSVESGSMSNTRPGASRFKDLFLLANNDRKGIVARYSKTGNYNDPALLVISIDTPSILIIMDPVIALKGFFDTTSESEVTHERDHTPISAASDINIRIDIQHVTVSVLADDKNPNSEAVSLNISQVSLSRQGILAITVNGMKMSLLQMNRRDESVKIFDDTDLSLSMDSRQDGSQEMLNLGVNISSVVVRMSYRDMVTISSIWYSILKSIPTSGSRGAANELSTYDPQVSLKHNKLSDTHLEEVSQKSKVLMSGEKLRATLDGFHLVLIEDTHEIPLLNFDVKPFIVSLNDWSNELRLNANIETSLNYFNQKNSHWEPLVDPWSVSVLVMKERLEGLSIRANSQERLDFNCSPSSIEAVKSLISVWQSENGDILQRDRGSYAPYRIRNRTGNAVSVWSEGDDDKRGGFNSAVRMQSGDSIDWRFDDWKASREYGLSDHNTLGLQFEDKTWERLRYITVDREGEYVYTMKSSAQGSSEKLVCEITVERTVKVITLRSTYKVENKTLYSLDIMLVDQNGNPIYAVERIAPGEDYTVPLDSVRNCLIRVQPDQGFGYRWSAPIEWRSFNNMRRGATIACNHTDHHEAPFRLQMWPTKFENMRNYPRINLVLRAPLELENLLPYNIQYKLYDKNREQHWSSYLRSGGIMPVHAVELDHLVLLNITILDTGLRPSDFAIINTELNSDFDIEDQISVRDLSDRVLNLKLNYIKYSDSGGSFKVQLYSPFILINESKLPFSLRSIRRPATPKDVATSVDTSRQSDQIIPFLFSHPNKKGHEFILKIEDSRWSEPLSFKALSAESAIVLSSASRRSEINVGLSWKEGPGRYKMTKFIVLAPRFFIRNMLDQPIFFRERGSALGGHCEVRAGRRSPIFHMSENREKLFTFAFTGIDASWSMPINIEDIGTTYIRMYSPPSSSSSSSFNLIAVEVILENATIFIRLMPNTDNVWPFFIENNSTHSVSIAQIDSEQPEVDKNHLYHIKPMERSPYAWDNPARVGKKIRLMCYGYFRDVNMMEIGSLPPLMIKNGMALSIDVRANGPSQVLSITDYRAEFSLYKYSELRGNSKQLRRAEGSPMSSNGFEAVQDQVSPTLSITVNVAGLGVSAINRKLVEIIYLSVGNLAFEYSYSDSSQSYNLSCGTLQIDNQLHDAQFPVILQPTPINSSTQRGAASLPTLQVSCILLNDSAHGVIFVKYASILLQAITLKVDEVFMHAFMDLVASLAPQVSTELSSESDNDKMLSQFNEIPDPKSGSGGQYIYFEVLELQPLLLSISFVRNISTDDDGSSRLQSQNPIAVVVNAMTMAIGNLENATLQFNALGLKDIRLSLPDIQSRVIYHYRQELLRQVYRLIGSANFLGNPVGLFTNVSSGVADIFYEPWRGVVMHGNKELGVGLAKGAASFFKKTVFGISDSVSRVTGSLGKGLSAATLDSEYQARRRREQRRNPPRHLLYGVTAGAEAFASSLASGVEGLATKPFEGAETEGAVGFFKGVGKGVIGAFTKPVVGVFDFASNVSEGIRNTTTVFDSPQRDRVRKPRLIPADGILRPFSNREALGQYWLKDLNNGMYQKDFYVAHINVADSTDVVMLTTNRILFFPIANLRNAVEMSLRNLQSAVIEDTGIRFISKLGKEHDHFVPIAEKASQNWFFNSIASVVRAYNAQRKIDK